MNVQYALNSMLKSFSNPPNGEGQSSTPNKIDVFVNFDSVSGTSVSVQKAIRYCAANEVESRYYFCNRPENRTKNTRDKASNPLTCIIIA